MSVYCSFYLYRCINNREINKVGSLGDLEQSDWFVKLTQYDWVRPRSIRGFSSKCWPDTYFHIWHTHLVVSSKVWVPSKYHRSRNVFEILLPQSLHTQDAYYCAVVQFPTMIISPFPLPIVFVSHCCWLYFLVSCFLKWEHTLQYICETPSGNSGPTC